MFALSARRLHVFALVAAPVLVMAARDKDFAIGKLLPGSGRIEPVGVDPGHVTHVVAIGLQPVDGGDFFPEKKILRAGVNAGAIPGGDGSVVAHLESPAVAGGPPAAIKTVAMPSVIGVPGGVAGLKNNVVCGVVV